jgi:sugar lactone lactonase YvrE
MRLPIVALLLLAWPLVPASAHPASGIVMDAEGQVFFLDTGEPGRFSGFIWRIDRQGRLTAIHDSGGHFLALDGRNGFAGSDLMGWFRSKRTQWLLRTPVPGSTVALIQADGSPIGIGPDGALYYASADQLERAGVEQIARLAPDGALTTPTPSLPAVAKRLGGIRGLALGHDGSLYISYENAVQKVTTGGDVTALAEKISLTECDADAPENGRLPYLRGLAVDRRGVVYAAATGCRAIVRIAGNRVETILKAERPWSPTGVAVAGDDVYVLEYTNHNGLAKEWQPRVRRIRHDGTVTTLATVSPADRARAARR